MTNDMPRWEFSAHGLEHLALARAPVPSPGPREVLVEVEAVSLNHSDILIAENGLGAIWAFPFVPGSDMAGRVIAVGARY
jgi:alcohol dehydrogenase